MSQQLISRSPDLKKLRDEGYDISITGGYLLVKQVPYVNASKNVLQGTFICKLDLSGDKTQKPSAHDAYWQGEPPCHSSGEQIVTIINSIRQYNLGNNLIATARFSAKTNYRDFYHKVTTYVGRIVGEAAMLDETATAKVFPPVPEDDTNNPFKYVDTASSRSDIGNVNEKLKGLRIGIVGLGGTGSYVLDLVAKTWVAEIHLIDGDDFSQHNAFRAPSAASIEELSQNPCKVHYFENLYTKMRNGIHIYPEYLTASNIVLLDGLDFVFICVDKAEAKRLAVSRCTANGLPFVEVGVGAIMNEDKIGGIIRTVLSTPENRDLAIKHISFDDSNPDNVYATNIQIAELNSLNASLAVMLWKKYYAMYLDTRETYLIEVPIPSCDTIVEGMK